MLVVDEMASVVNCSTNSDVTLSNAIDIVVSGNRAVDENVVGDSVVVVVVAGVVVFVVVAVVVVVGVGVVIGSFGVVTMGLVGMANVDGVVGRFDVVVVVVVGFAVAADAVDGMIGFAVVGFFVATVLGLSSSTVV